MHIAVVIIIPLLVLLAVGIFIYFYTRKAPNVAPSPVTNMSLSSGPSGWFIQWIRPQGSDPMGYVYVISGITTPGIIDQGTTTSTTIDLNEQKYTVGQEYQVTLISKNNVGESEPMTRIFTPPWAPNE